MQPWMTPTTPREGIREHMLLLREFVRKPFDTAALAPSSRHLALKMAASVPLHSARNVVELGPGTGAITSALLPALHPEAKFLAVELNSRFATEWREKFPGQALAQGNVAELGRLCAEHGMDGVDCIVSGLPWPSFPTELQRKGLREVLSVLKPGGQMATFGYHVGLAMPNGRHFLKLTEREFRKVEWVDWEWRNLPPAYILRCSR